MPDKQLSAGDPIEARCTKCRSNTNHIVIAMVEEAPAKVKCNTCEREHKYRPPSAAKKKTVSRTVDPKVTDQEEWRRLQPEMDSAKAKNYSMDGDYRLKTLIRHPKFGLGLVQRVVGERKVEVLFEDGRKTMRCK
ncbi:MAG TPA: hypothetical protein VJ910_04395 [Desulfuromonadales bacterium]|nr:hypothetical protein [Desulfuromonadales bacterium]